MSEMDDEGLLAALGVDVTPVKASSHTPEEQRIIAGFEDILRFVEAHGRPPQHGEDRDIFERIYAVRLDRLRALKSTHPLLSPMDPLGLLSSAPSHTTSEAADALDDQALLSQLGVASDADESDITHLRHVRSYEERKAAEEIANRIKCEDFAHFQPLFEKAEIDLNSGERKTLRFGRDASVAEDNFFILGGQMVYVAEMSEPFAAPNGDTDARLRVIYSNGTESNLLMRSLQRALYKDETGRRLTDPGAGPLFSEESEPDDIESGTIYVLRSQSDIPFVAEHRELIHKIGVTGGKVEKRIANAVNDATYLLAEVEVVASYRLSNINRTKLENIFHRLFSSAQIDLTISDRFGKEVRPREWFLVPLPVIDEAVRRIVDGSIVDMVYDAKTATLERSRK
ncbi:GIY-YIG nuclease family protein [Oleiagrimonas sp. C23AA]|uniref:GIY-YIG nuclease family protein n=1 Tax=Oleiagrimonas sp. C23AA TaxID=2719047 RepID=UPI00142295F7|nr:GIY-YIG nuclease family protein [Oleiagrimonas sp. C23AA]NII10669.1 GIY-YIG nuclease family protein [Oleiagrimonas sp. C23AA]